MADEAVGRGRDASALSASCADEERVSRYRRETGFAETLEKIVPAAFPASGCELGDRRRHSRRARRRKRAAVHESQSFRYCAPLRVGESYDLTVSLRREATPPRLARERRASRRPAGEALVHVETLLRIVPRPAGGGRAMSRAAPARRRRASAGLAHRPVRRRRARRLCGRPRATTIRSISTRASPRAIGFRRAAGPWHEAAGGFRADADRMAARSVSGAARRANSCSPCCGARS